MTAFALLFTLSAIGISETVYLIRKRIIAEKPFCPIGETCAVVLSSKYNKIFLIPNDVLGLMFYIFAAFATGIFVVVPNTLLLLKILTYAAVAFASLTSFVLFYLQWKVIKAWCFWCVMSASTIWLMQVIILINRFKTTLQ